MTFQKGDWVMVPFAGEAVLAKILHAYNCNLRLTNYRVQLAKGRVVTVVSSENISLADPLVVAVAKAQFKI